MRYLIRVWLPDRPGALGLVASRIGAAQGDVIGIEILERGAGRAVDELVVDLPEPDLLDLLVSEIAQVDGVDVEDVRELGFAAHDPALAALDTAARLAEAARADVVETLCRDVVADFECDWALALKGGTGVAVAAVGDSPSPAWVAAFVEGALHLQHEGDGSGGPDDVAWAQLLRHDVAVAVGRKGRPFRARERRQLATLARIADAALAG
jgi:hypothetical protein